MNLLPQDEARLRILLGYGYGFAVLVVYFALAMILALGKVEKETSYGLEMVLVALGPLGGSFVGWAFGMANNRKEP